MSHKGTNWAISQRNLKPASKLLLWHLADCHNAHTGRCDPSQDRLAHDMQMSRSSVNKHLNILETKGLIKRQKRYNGARKRQETTSYILGFEIEEAPDIVKAVSENRTEEPVSEKGQKLCPKNGQSSVRNSDTNLGREPGIEPVLAKATTHTNSPFEEFWKVFPRPRDKVGTEKLFVEVCKTTNSAWVLRSAKFYAIEQKGNRPQYIARSDNWLKDQRWMDFPEKPAVLPAVDRAEQMAADVIAGRYVSHMSMSSSMMGQIIDRDLATKEQLKARGFYG